MPANLTKYCLEQLTDYADFESLCHDLMVLEGYPKIEPLGGFSDKGRDAVHICTAGKSTIFAYSVREDWRAKLSEDATKIKRHNHSCDNLTFVTTSDFTAHQRDEAILTIQKEYGWTLELFGLERLRLLLDTKYPQIKSKHPSIFPPEFLKIQEKALINENKSHLFISFAPQDKIFAEWLTRKLTAEGYLVWCESYKLLGGDKYPTDVNKALKSDSFRMVAIYSDASLKNMEVMRQRALAFNLAEEMGVDFLIPIKLDNFDKSQLDRESAKLDFILFNENWAKGLYKLLENLSLVNCPKPLVNGKEIATEHFLEDDVLTNEPEFLYANGFRVERLPETVRRFKIDEKFPDKEALNLLWAYRKISDEVVLSFQHPPKEVSDKYTITDDGGYSWRDVERITWIEKNKDKWINITNLVSELIRKSLLVLCHRKGLKFSQDTKLQHFTEGLIDKNRLSVTLPNGKKTSPLGVLGERKYFRPQNKSEYYRYHLAPTFFIKQDLFGEFVAVIRLKIHFTDTDKIVLPARKRISRRKHLCKGWWNDDFFKRTLLLVQFLSDNEQLVMGDLSREQIIISSKPISFKVSNGIDEERLDSKSYERDERIIQDDNDDE